MRLVWKHIFFEALVHVSSGAVDDAWLRHAVVFHVVVDVLNFIFLTFLKIMVAIDIV